MKYVTLTTLLIFFGVSLAQTTLTIRGRTTEPNTKVTLKSNGEVISSSVSTENSKGGKYKVLDIEAGKDYELWFEKTGFVSKFIELDFSNGTLKNNSETQVDIEMERNSSFTSTEVFNDPIGIMLIDQYGSITLDMPYTKAQREKAAQYRIQEEPTVSDAPSETYWPNGNLKTEKLPNKNGGFIWKSYYEDGTLETYTEDLNGKQHGNVKFYYPSGQLQTDCNYKYGKVEGKCTQYYENGEVQLSETYSNGKRNGTSTLYDEQGNEIKFSTYVNGEAIGPYKTYKPDGSLLESGNMGTNGFEGKRTYTQDDGFKIEETYVNGMKNGTSTAWRPDGSIYSTTNFVNNKQHGDAFLYYEDGSVKFKTTYNHGAKDGESISYGPDGSVQTVNLFQNNVLIKKDDQKVDLVSNTSPKDKLAKNSIEYPVTESKATDCEVFHLVLGKFKGAPSKELTQFLLSEENKNMVTSTEDNNDITIYHSTWQGTYEEVVALKDQFKERGCSSAKVVCVHNPNLSAFNADGSQKNGQIERTAPNGGKVVETYVNGIKEGPFEMWHPNGQLFQKGTMKDGKLSGSFVAYHDNGKVSAKGNYKNGRKDGDWVIYHPNGEVSQEVTFNEGQEEGVSKFYHANGVYYGLFDMENGEIMKIHSYQINYKGEVTSIWTENNGITAYERPDGKDVVKYKNGDPYLKFEFKNDKKTGKWQWFNEKGKLCLERWYENDQLVDEKYYKKDFQPMITTN